MTFRIETAVRGRLKVFILSGRIEAEAIAELRRLLEPRNLVRKVVIDLKDVTLVDREGIQFLLGCEADAITLEHCAPYVREWIEREKGGAR